MNSRAKKLFGRMQQTRANWKFKDARALYLGCGFEEREAKGSHVVFIHPRHKHLRATLPKHGELPKGYIKDAVNDVKELMTLEGW